MIMYAKQAKQGLLFSKAGEMCSTVGSAPCIICMEITRCNNYDLYNGACGMFGSTGMIIHNFIMRH